MQGYGQKDTPSFIYLYITLTFVVVSTKKLKKKLNIKTLINKLTQIAIRL